MKNASNYKTPARISVSAEPLLACMSIHGDQLEGRPEKTFISLTTGYLECADRITERKEMSNESESFHYSSHNRSGSVLRSCFWYQLYIYFSKLFPIQVFTKPCFCRMSCLPVGLRRIS